MCMLRLVCVFASVRGLGGGSSERGSRRAERQPEARPARSPSLHAVPAARCARAKRVLVALCALAKTCARCTLRARRRDAGAAAEQEAQSSTASTLLGRLSDGLIYPNTVQAIAAANVADGLTSTEVARLSQLGASGRYPGNIARDLERSVRKTYGIEIEAYKLRVVLENGETIFVPVLPPHEMFAAAYANDPETFAAMYTGAHGEKAVNDFWQRCAGEAWVAQHPMLATGTRYAIPTVWHVDGVEVFSDDEFFMWSFRSCLTNGLLFDKKQYLCCVASHDVPEKADRQRAEAEVLKYIAWSMTWAGRGVGPSAGYYGEVLEDGSFAAQMAGCTLAGPWRLVFAGACVDWKARRDTNRFARHFNAKFVCDHCCAQMLGKSNDTVDALSFRNFRPDALWRQTLIDHNKYVQQCLSSGHVVSPWHVIPGWRLELCLWDWMHSGPLGTARDFLASAVCTLVQERAGRREDPNMILKTFLREMRLWMLAKGLRTFRPKLAFSSLRKATTEYPEFPSYVKAAHMKWYAYFFAEKSRRCCTGTWPSRIRAVCLWAYCRCTYLMEISGVHFSQQRADNWAWCMRLHLQSYQWLSHRAHTEKLYLWHLRPKAHVMDHMASHVQETCRNPLRYACYDCESFLGKLKRIGLKCHGRTMPSKLIGRVQLHTALRWKRHRDSAAKQRARTGS